MLSYNSKRSKYFFWEIVFGCFNYYFSSFYWLLMPIICILLPVNAPMEYWTDGTASAIFVAGVLRYAITMHVLYLIHSAIHIWGLKPEDKYVDLSTFLVKILTKISFLDTPRIRCWCSSLRSPIGQCTTTSFLGIIKRRSSEDTVIRSSPAS